MSQLKMCASNVGVNVKSTATTPEAYIASLPPDRAEIIAAVREMILENLPTGFEEAMNWGMISYQVPLSAYPDTYNKQPFMYAALASQKNYCALYLMAPYGSGAVRLRLEEGFRNAGKRLDMGKSCIRFKRLDDLPLGVVAEIIGGVTMEKFVAAAKSTYPAKK